MARQILDSGSKSQFVGGLGWNRGGAAAVCTRQPDAMQAMVRLLPPSTLASENEPPARLFRRCYTQAALFAKFFPTVLGNLPTKIFGYYIHKTSHEFKITP